MSPAPPGWEQKHGNTEISQTIPLFAATDPQYSMMNLGYCRDKIDSGCMVVWRKTGIDWTNANNVTTNGIAIAFHRWRPRNANGTPKEQRFCLCLFLGTNQTNANAILNDLETAVRAFADDQVARNRFYVVKEVNVTYAQRVEDVFTSESRRLSPRANFPNEHGWPARRVWQVADWT